MPLDTIKLRSPYLPASTVARIEARGKQTSRVDLGTGEVEFEFIRTPLAGSYDSRISILPMHEDSRKGKSGRIEWHPSEPYVYVECSLAKVFFGQNIYGGPENLQEASQALIRLLEDALQVKLPKAALWRVYRVDWAENYRLPFEQIQAFFSGIYTVSFPRRRVQKYSDTAVYIPGTTTTIKLYHKGPEFAEHDKARLYRHFLVEGITRFGRKRNRHAPESYAARKVAALQRLANRRLRVEVEVHAEKLDYEFSCKPYVRDVPDDFFRKLHDSEIKRLFREGASDVELVRTSEAVQKRLTDEHGQARGNLLYGFWAVLSTRGEDAVRCSYTRATFYRNRRHLEKSGVSWHQTDNRLVDRSTVQPSNFSPIRSDPRRCTAQVRETPAFLSVRGSSKRPDQAQFNGEKHHGKSTCDIG